MTNTASTKSSQQTQGPVRPWYREPLVLMVVGGPLVVVCASFFTLYLAITNPDPVLDRSASRVVLDEELLKKLSPEQKAALEFSVTPARVARNHATSPVVPKE